MVLVTMMSTHGTYSYIWALDIDFNFSPARGWLVARLSGALEFIGSLFNYMMSGYTG